MAQDILSNFVEAVRNAIMQMVRVGNVGRQEADGTTTVVVAGRDHYIYVRTGATTTGGEILEAYNKGIPRLAGAPVLLVKWGRMWTVIGVDADSPAVTPDTFSVAYHVHKRDNGLVQSVNDLDGMPSDLAGRGGALLRVNDDEDGYYLADAASGGTGTVDSVNGAIGVVVLDADDIDDAATTNKFATAAELSKLAGIEALADVTDAANIASSISGASTDDTITDASVFGYVKAGVLVKTAWSNIKSVLKTYFDTLYAPVPTTGTWSPVITGSGGDPTVTYTTQGGDYVSFSGMVFYNLVITISTISGGSGEARFSLPLTVGAATAVGVARPFGVDLPGTPVGLSFTPVSGTTFGVIQAVQDDASTQQVLVSGLAAGDTIRATGFYFV